MRWTLLALAALTTSCGFLPQAKNNTSELILCRPEVPRTLMRGNATFAIVYKGRVDMKGAVVDLEFEKPVAGIGSIAECAGEWELDEAWRGKEVSILLQWEHGRGWTELSVVREQRRLTILDPAPRDYWKAH